MRVIAIATLGFISLFSCGSCVRQSPYFATQDLPPDSNGVISTMSVKSGQSSAVCSRDKSIPASCVHIVEYDEFGNPFSREQVGEVVSAAKEIAESDGGGNVILFVHGWHGSADFEGEEDEKTHKFKVVNIEGNENLKSFLEIIDQANREGGKKKTIGIYVAWRGDSIRSEFPTAWASYLFTFWDRKSTAHNIGAGGGVSDLIRRLSRIRQSSNKVRLVLVGHSFGGAILYSATSQSLGDQIQNYAYDEDGSDKSRIADLEVLINPAFEAMRLKPLFDMARSYEYPKGTRPSLVIVTTNADVATRYAFPMGRYLGTLFQYYPSLYYKELNLTAIGHYQPMITHQLIAGSCTESDYYSSFSDENDQGSTRNFCFSLLKSKFGNSSSMIWTRCDGPAACDEVNGNSYLSRGSVTEGKIPYRFPIINIITDKSVMPSHSCIWTPEMKNFLYKLLFALDAKPPEKRLVPYKKYRMYEGFKFDADSE